jgi:hypothetical protein
MKEAELKAFEAYSQNTYLFEKFLNGEITPIAKEELVGFERTAVVMDFQYSN